MESQAWAGVANYGLYCQHGLFFEAGREYVGHVQLRAWSVAGGAVGAVNVRVALEAERVAGASGAAAGAEAEAGAVVLAEVTGWLPQVVATGGWTRFDFSLTPAAGVVCGSLPGGACPLLPFPPQPDCFLVVYQYTRTHSPHLFPITPLPGIRPGRRAPAAARCWRRVGGGWSSPYTRRAPRSTSTTRTSARARGWAVAYIACHIIQPIRTLVS
jgi:hypothetical protein